MNKRTKIEAQLSAENESLRQQVAVLQATEQRLRKYFSQNLIGMAAVTLENGWLEVNDRLCEILGHTRDELLQTNWLKLTHPDDVEAAVSHYQRLVSGEIDHYVLEKRYVRKDGSTVWATIAVQAFYRDDGSIDCVVGLMEDISARKQAEMALAREHETLKHLLQASDHERQLIAYEIHDGLTQHLAGALIQFQTFDHLKDTRPKDAANAFHAGLTMLQQGHFEARRLIADVRPPILDELGVVAAVGHLVNEQSQLVGPVIEYRSRVQFDRLVPALENAVYRIAQEGLRNACRHSQSKRVRIGLVQRADRLRIEIRDWGVGFDVANAPKNRYGLEGIRQRTRLLDGRCAIRSAPGAGTRVTVELPVVPRE